MFGIKTVGEKKFCAKCGMEVENNHRYCHRCGNPLKIEAIAEYTKEVKEQMETFVSKVVDHANENNTTLKESIKEVLELY